MISLRLGGFLAALGVGMSFDPPTLDFAKLNADLTTFSEKSVAFITNTLTPAKVAPQPIDAEAAAQVDEDLDYRIAEHRDSVEAWHAFLAAHPDGAHASAAQAALDKLEPPPAPPPPVPPPKAVPLLVPPVVEVANAPVRPPDDIFAALERAPPPPTIVTVTKWRERRTRTVVHWRVARPGYYQPGPPSFLAALFGPRPGRWRRGHVGN